MTKREDTLLKLKWKGLIGTSEKNCELCLTSEGVRRRSNFNVSSPINLHNRKIIRAKWMEKNLAEEEKKEDVKIEKVRSKLQNLGV